MVFCIYSLLLSFFFWGGGGVIVSVLLSAHDERFSVSRIWDLLELLLILQVLKPLVCQLPMPFIDKVTYFLRYSLAKAYSLVGRKNLSQVVEGNIFQSWTERRRNE